MERSNRHRPDPVDQSGRLSYFQCGGKWYPMSHRAHSTQVYVRNQFLIHRLRWLGKIIGGKKEGEGKKGERVTGAYGIPRHCLEPFPNGTKCFSSTLAVTGLSHREGSNFSAFGKMSLLRCIIHELMPTMVWGWDIRISDRKNS